MGDALELLLRPTSSARPSRATIASTPGDLAAMEANGDIYLDSYAGWYSVRDEAYYDESELTKAPDGERCARRRARRSSGPRRRATSSASRPTRTGCSTTMPSNPDFIRPRDPAQRGRQLRQGRAAGPLDLAHQLRLGHAGAGRPEARHVRLARRAHQLHHRRPASPTRPSRCGTTGRPTSTSSARTSSASTPSTGRPS